MSTLFLNQYNATGWKLSSLVCVPLENPGRSELRRIVLRCEFSPPMPTSLFVLFVTLRSILRSRVDLQLENLALRHQIGVLQRSLKKRPKLTSLDRQPLLHKSNRRTRLSAIMSLLVR